MGPSLTGKPEGEGCKEKTWWAKNEKCAYSFQDDEEKSRWFFLILEEPASSDLGVLIWEGKPEPLASCLCVARLLGRGKTKGKTFLFPQKNFNLGTCSHRGAGDGTKIYQLGINELQVLEKPNPTGSIKGTSGSLLERSRGSLATGIAGFKASGIGADLLSLHSTFFPHNFALELLMLVQ